MTLGRHTGFPTNDHEAILLIECPLILHVKSLKPLEKLLVDGCVGRPRLVGTHGSVVMSCELRGEGSERARGPGVARCCGVVLTALPIMVSHLIGLILSPVPWYPVVTR